MKKTFIALLFTVVLFACKSGGEENTKEQVAPANMVSLTKEQQASAGIATAALSMQQVSEVVRVHGRVEAPPQNYVSISAPLGGFLRSTELLPGVHVRKGEVLATIEDQAYIDLQQEYLSLRAKISALEKEYQRQKGLSESKASSEKMLEQSEADFLSARAQFAGLREKLLLCGIQPEKLNENSLSRSIPLVSPIDGYVAKVNVNVGKHVAENDVLFELVNPDDIHLALVVFEKDINRISVGQKVKAFSNNGGKEYDCRVILLGRNLNPDRSLEIHCHFDQYDHSLLPGMYMNADILADTAKVPALPQDAILMSDGKQFVFAEVAPLKYERIAVETGSSENGYTAVRNPEALRDKKVVVKGAYSILMKMNNKEEE